MRNKVVCFILVLIGVMLVNLDVAFTEVEKKGEVTPAAQQTKPEDAGNVFFGYVRLLGTIYHSDETGEKREAVITDVFTRKKGTYTEGSILPCGVKLKQIKADSVVLEKNNQQKTLSLHDKNNYFKEIKGLMKHGYHQIAPNEWIISPHYLFKSSEELINIAMNSELAFSHSDDISGLIISSLSNKSKIVNLGFESGDKVVNVNGVDLESVTSLSKAYQKMGNCKNVAFKIQRGGKPVDLLYWIAPKGSPRYNMQDVYKAVKQLFIM